MNGTIDLENDVLTPVNEITKRRLGKRIAPATLWRWRLKGIKTPTGRVKLECVRVAGCWCTTPKAFAQFIREQSNVAAVDDDGPRHRDERTTRRLQSAGLL